MKLAVLILAAGASTRFGGCKLLADVGGRPLLQNSIDLASSVAPDDVHVVSGAWHQALLDATSAGELTGARLVYSDCWREGLSASLRAGIRHLEPDYEAVLVLLADQVALTRDDLMALLDAFDGGGICCGFYRGRRGVPAIFPVLCSRASKRFMGIRVPSNCFTTICFRCGSVRCPIRRWTSIPRTNSPGGSPDAYSSGRSVSRSVRRWLSTFSAVLPMTFAARPVFRSCQSPPCPL